MIEDLSAFFADFGVTVTYGSQTALAVFESPDGDMLGGRMISTGYAIRYKSGDLVGLKHNDTLSINGVGYRVNEVRLMFDGLTVRTALEAV